jgi:hypothetical protein
MRNKEFDKILDEMKRIHDSKNSDYAGDDPLSNLKLSEMAGIEPWKGVVVRLGDKYSRLCNFAKKGKFEVKDESVEDTLKDLAVYGILALILYREGSLKK